MRAATPSPEPRAVDIVVSALTFEVLAFRALPVTAAVAVLELEGRFSDRAPVRLGRPALLVEAGRDRFELLPTSGPEAAAGPGGVPWRASFALPAASLASASFALEVGRDLLVDLPAPDLGPGDRDEGERLARLAREANDLRRRLDEAAARLAEAEAAAEAARAEAAAAAEEAARSVEAVRAQSDHLLAQAREEAEAALAAERERRDREVAAVREQANHSLATAEEEAEQAIAAVQARAEAERARHERELAAVREQADVALATALREQEERLLGGAPGAAGTSPAAPSPAPTGRGGSPDAPTPGPVPGRLVSPDDVAPQPADRARPTTAAGRLWRRDALVDDPATAATEILDTGNDETIRILSGRRRPRHSAEDEREPATIPADAIRAGARAIGSTRRDAPSRRLEPQRVGALIALAVAILAFVLVVVLRVGPF